MVATLDDTRMMQTWFLQDIEPRSRRLLIVVEGSEDMGRLLEYVIRRVVKDSPIEAILLNVQPNQVNVQPNQEQDGKPCDPTERESGRDRCGGDFGKRIVRSAARRLDQLGIVNRERVEVGDPAATIVRCAEEEQCDLIVLADTNGNSAAHSVERKPGLSVQSVLKEAPHQIAPVPVVIVNSPQPLTDPGRVGLYVGVA